MKSQENRDVYLQWAEVFISLDALVIIEKRRRKWVFHIRIASDKESTNYPMIERSLFPRDMSSSKNYEKRVRSKEEVTPASYLIIGCGHFGSRAAEKLFQRDHYSKIIIVDKNKKALQKISRLPIKTVLSDGISHLSQFISKGGTADYIIPAVPIHLAFEFILSQLKPLGGKRGKVPSLSGLPNPMFGKTGDLYTSLADFLCSEDCPEPARYCMATGRRREKPLYQILKDLKGSFESRVIRSQQLGPGIGGFQPKALLDLLEDMKKKKKPCQLILISTASRCHGVTSAMSF